LVADPASPVHVDRRIDPNVGVDLGAQVVDGTRRDDSVVAELLAQIVERVTVVRIAVFSPERDRFVHLLVPPLHCVGVEVVDQRDRALLGALVL
jgi:hypothetical protein